MANHLFASVLLVVLLLTSFPPSFSSARLLNHNFNPAASEPTFILALPSDADPVRAVNLKPHHVLPCHRAAGAGKQPRRAGKYGPLVLNMLPKGTVPPSGPSKGTNSINS